MNEKAPKHLKPATRKWFEAVCAEYALEEHHRRLLTLACESWDRCQQARESIDKNGLTEVDRFGQSRARPEVAIERDSRVAFARLVREMGLDLAGPDEAARPSPRTGRAR